MDKKVNFIFVWRLVKEKGFHLLMWAIEKIWRMRGGEKEKIHIHIFGRGAMAEEFGTICDHHDFVTYHWFQPKKEVLKVWKKCHYTLMPSLFLETFWLSALDGLSVWTPVIGFQKGGLAQFIEDKYSISESWNDTKDSEKLKRKIVLLTERFDAKKRWIAKKHMKKKYEWFVREARYKHFKNLLPKSMKRIMIVSDYSADIWWIENWLYIVVRNLKEKWYKVQFVWWTNKTVSWKWLFFNLFKTTFNWKAWRKIEKTLKKFKPDIVWRHSVHRVLGRYPLSLAKDKTYRQRIMYHDFGLFHPYPSMVYNEKQLTESRTFRWFMREWLEKWRWNFPLLIAKWISYSCIRYQLKKNINLHLVPSAYMLGSVTSKWYIWENAAIDVLPHFIDCPK